MNNTICYGWVEVWDLTNISFMFVLKIGAPLNYDEWNIVSALTEVKNIAIYPNDTRSGMRRQGIE